MSRAPAASATELAAAVREWQAPALADAEAPFRLAFRLEEPQEAKVRPKSYAENFKFGRPDRWTH